MEQLATGSALGQAPAPAPAPAPASAPSRPSQGSSVDVGNSSTKPKQPEKSLLLTEDIPFKRVPSRKSTQGLYAEPYLLSEQEALLYEKPNHAQDVEDIRYRVGDFVAVGGIGCVALIEGGGSAGDKGAGRVGRAGDYTCRLYFAPEQVKCGRLPWMGRREIFMTNFVCTIPTSQIKEKVLVVGLKSLKPVRSKRKNKQVYFCRVTYNVDKHVFVNYNKVSFLCLCVQPENPDRTFIQCGWERGEGYVPSATRVIGCGRKYHPRCVGTSRKIVEAVGSFFCPLCKRRAASAGITIPGVGGAAAAAGDGPGTKGALNNAFGRSNISKGMQSLREEEEKAARETLLRIDPTKLMLGFERCQRHPHCSKPNRHPARCKLDRVDKGDAQPGGSPVRKKAPGKRSPASSASRSPKQAARKRAGGKSKAKQRGGAAAVRPTTAWRDPSAAASKKSMGKPQKRKMRRSSKPLLLVVPDSSMGDHEERMSTASSQQSEEDYPSSRASHASAYSQSSSTHWGDGGGGQASSIDLQHGLPNFDSSTPRPLSAASFGSIGDVAVDSINVTPLGQMSMLEPVMPMSPMGQLSLNVADLDVTNAITASPHTRYQSEPVPNLFPGEHEGLVPGLFEYENFPDDYGSLSAFAGGNHATPRTNSKFPSSVLSGASRKPKGNEKRAGKSPAVKRRRVSKESMAGGSTGGAPPVSVRNLFQSSVLAAAAGTSAGMGKPSVFGEISKQRNKGLHSSKQALLFSPMVRPVSGLGAADPTDLTL